MKPHTDIRVRFAPSPTGYLHVGGARTALFNWLYARRHGGVLVLRIEDTDRQRSSEEMVQAILDGLSWLGIDHDEGPFFQSEARERHTADARRLLDEGKAYRCFCTPDELKRHREELAAKKENGPTCPAGCRERPFEEAAARTGGSEPSVVRFAVPGGEIAWNDLVHGPTRFDGSALDDFVLLRSDGTPTYMLSVVSDDADQRITHIIRGDDHLSNTPKQILLYRALGKPVPVFAHLPLILGPDKKRLSKRHGAVSVLEYRTEGFLPEAVFNYLALLGWSAGDDRQKFQQEDLIQAFSLEGAGKSGAVFDRTKLEWLNGRYIEEMDLEAFAAAVHPGLEKAGLWSPCFERERKEWFLKLVRLLQPRCRTLNAFPGQAEPFLRGSDSLEYEEKPARKHLKGENLRRDLAELTDAFARLSDWNPESLESVLRESAERKGISAGKLIHPVRLAVTGRGNSPGLFEVLELLGKERVLSRLRRMVDFLTNRPSPV